MEAETKTEPEKTAQTRKLTVRCQFCNTWNRIDAGKVTDGPKCGKCGKPILLERPVPLNDETFARTISESELPVAVDFYADWCGPCRMMAPAVDALAAHMQGKALVGKLNTDHASRTASGFNIRGPNNYCLQRRKGGRPSVRGDAAGWVEAADGEGRRDGLILVHRSSSG
jgi:thioredoxin 2